jgi:uncharacterized protein YkwD
MGNLIMKIHLKSPMLGLLCAVALSSCADQPDPTHIPVSASLKPESQTSRRSGGSMSDQVFDKVNSYRRSQGLGDLQRHAGLDRLAQSHSEYLLANRGKFSIYGKNISHFGFEGRAASARQTLGMLSVSENVAAANYPGQSAPAVLLELWRTSKDHQYNMTQKWTHSGMGVTVDKDGMVFATQIFATKNHSQLVLRDRMNSF